MVSSVFLQVRQNFQGANNIDFGGMNNMKGHRSFSKVVFNQGQGPVNYVLLVFV